MNITEAQLEDEYQRAKEHWPAIHNASVKYHLPRFALYAVGSRETNLTNETGDGGHGHGIFQLDDRSHTIPHPFPVAEQCELAAHMLHGLLVQFAGDHRAAFAAYNCGAGNVQAAQREHRDVDYYTAGRDYGADVLERMHTLQRLHPPKDGSEDVPNAHIEPAIDHDIEVTNDAPAGGVVPANTPADTVQEGLGDKAAGKEDSGELTTPAAGADG